MTGGERNERTPRRLGGLIALGLVSWCLYLAVSLLCRHCAYGVPTADRPIPAVLGLFAAAFVGYLAALRVAVRCSSERGSQKDGERDLLRVIVSFAVCFRVTLLFSEPFQELDVYRYLWDGRVTTAGVSPYRFSPAQVLAAGSSDDEPPPGELRRLAALRDASPAVRTIVSRIHHNELTTIYPPVSQAVFALAAATTPIEADVYTHVVVMKVWITAFDLAAIWVLIALLRRAGRPVGWSLACAWCPLVLKEFANSGHLDAIAVFLTALAVLLTQPRSGRRWSPSGRFPSVVLLGAVVLGLAVGAKLYPIVLAPLLTIALLRRLGWKSGLAFAVLAVTTAGLVCSPMLFASHASASGSAAREPPLDPSRPSIARRGRGEGYIAEEPPVPPSATPGNPGNSPPQGLTTFLSRWKMNDFLFLIVVENLTPSEDVSPSHRPWFLVTSESQRQNVAQAVSRLTGMPESKAPFAVARAASGIVFLALMLWWALRAHSVPDAAGVGCQKPGFLEKPGFFPVTPVSDSGPGIPFLEAAFLTLAWFWLLLPTGNPWYWTWAMVFVPFARNRAWIALSGAVFIYYTRFWFAARWPDSPVPPTGYPGALFFDYVMAWIEFGPWFVWLAVEWATRRVRERSQVRM